MRSLRASFVVAAIALGIFGLGRFLFNLVALRVFGPALVGSVNVALSSWTVVAILIGTVPGFVTSKFVADSIARGDNLRARRVFAMALCSVVAPGALVVLVTFGIRPTYGALWASYVPIFGSYLVVKAAAFAFREQRSYLVAEFCGFAGFATTCGIGCAVRSARLAEASLLIHPAIIVLVSISAMHSRLAWRGAIAEFVTGWREYGRFWGATLVNATAGLVSYHLVIVLAGLILVDRTGLGYLSVLLSSLAPLNFLPNALGTSLFPEIARRHGEGDLASVRRAVARSALALQALVLLAGTVLLLAPEPFLRVMHVPSVGPVRTTWILLAWVLQVTIVSSPCGHFLNATDFAGRHAVASLVFLLIGLATGIVGLIWFGLVGAGLMRIGVDAGLAWVRMAIAEKHLAWSRNNRWEVLACQAALVTAMAAGLLAPAWPWRLAIWLVGLLTQVPGLRRAFASSTPE